MKSLHPLKASLFAIAITIIARPLHMVQAASLTGSGSNLPFAPVVTSYSLASPSYVETVNVSFSATWDATAAAAWQGTFTGVGPIPAGGTRNSGTTNYDFTSLSTGVLPTGTSLFLIDLDSGSGPAEHITLKAYDATNTLMTTPWLDNPVADSGTTDGGGALQSTDLPGWSWDASTGTYTFDGSTPPGNPNVGVELLNNLPIGHLTENRDLSTASFDIRAPLGVPEPSTYAMLIIGAAVLLVRHRRKVS